MKRILLNVLMLAAIIVSCSKNKDDKPSETAGHIPGMGETPGHPQGTEFSFPAGIHQIGDIVGNEDDPGNADCVYDGQGRYVTVKIELKKDSGINMPTEVVFPPGLVIVSTEESFQHGILVDSVVVPIPPTPPGPGGSKRCQVTLMMLCVNEHRAPSSRFIKYQLGPVTNSPLIKDLVQRVANKKINYSNYAGDDHAYEQTMDVVQHALWHITDGEGLTEDDIADLTALPNR
jgi:hypothetical protein